MLSDGNMDKLKINILTVIVCLGLFVCGVNASDANKVVTPNSIKPQTQVQTNVRYISLTSPLLLVSSPAQYLNKNVEFTAKFNKFSTLGLDYPPAMRASQVYTGVLIERDDVKTHVIPLSELKMFIKIEKLKQFTELSSGDKIKIKGKVFSAALGDPWLDIEELSVLEHVNKEASKK